ncbi:hypothetical protein SDC9_164800 [bioreactor metagenome]|uniref:Uncharacterized protein n=1 Tax=bioreactor metagenome TaxID=1076179 RepID=A0A645FSM4_9ZZZZ
MSFQRGTAQSDLHRAVIVIVLRQRIIDVTVLQPAGKRYRNRQHKNMLMIVLIIIRLTASIMIDRIGVVPGNVPRNTPPGVGITKLNQFLDVIRFPVLLSTQRQINITVAPGKRLRPRPFNTATSVTSHPEIFIIILPGCPFIERVVPLSGITVSNQTEIRISFIEPLRIEKAIRLPGFIVTIVKVGMRVSHIQ